MVRAAKAIITYPPENGSIWKLSNVTLREPKDHELEIRIVATGICQSDIVHSLFHPEKASFPIVLGHEDELDFRR